MKFEYAEVIIGTHDGVIACRKHKKFRPCEECGEMPFAICDFCQKVIGVMWDNDATVVMCKCGAWVSVERNDDNE